MSTTVIPAAKPVDPKVTTEEVLKFVHDKLERSWGDYDKAGTLEDSAYYAGELDTLARLETILTGVEFTLEQ